MLVDDRPGTTHDCIDVVVTRKAADGDRRYVFIDTAGIRRKGRVTKAEDAVESLSVMQAIRSIERAHVVVLVVDANDGVAEQDAKILGLAEDRGRAMIIALNKNDLLDREEGKKIEELARDKISFVPYAPVVRLSAKTGRGVGELMRTVDQVRASFQQRISTGELNRFFAEVLEHRPPPTMGGRAPRFYYITQAEHSPPTFVVMTNAPDSVHFSYQRFVVNQLRKRFGFEGAPVRIVYKAKRQTPAAERVRLRAQAAGRPSHKPARRDPEDEASQAKAGPPREKSKTAGPPREKSEKAGPPREKSKAAGPKKTTRPPRRERKPHSK
jgi:GTP-binding protein